MTADVDTAMTLVYALFDAERAARKNPADMPAANEAAQALREFLAANLRRPNLTSQSLGEVFFDAAMAHCASNGIETAGECSWADMQQEGYAGMIDAGAAARAGAQCAYSVHCWRGHGGSARR